LPVPGLLAIARWPIARWPVPGLLAVTRLLPVAGLLPRARLLARPAGGWPITRALRPRLCLAWVAGRAGRGEPRHRRRCLRVWLARRTPIGRVLCHGSPHRQRPTGSARALFNRQCTSTGSARSATPGRLIAGAHTRMKRAG